MTARYFFLGLMLLAATQLRGRTQGTVFFDNRVSLPLPGINARVTFLDGTPVGAGFTAQLYGGPSGTPLESLEPQFPTTIFQTSTPAGLGYIQPVIVIVAGVERESVATLVMRVFDGPTWESSACRGEAAPLNVTLRGGAPGLDAYLEGLQPFQVNCIPEPSAATLLACGALALITWVRRRAIAPRPWCVEQPSREGT